MGFFSFLFRRPVFIGDAVFGRLRQVEIDQATGRAGFITEGSTFSPTGQPVCCHVDASEAGPTQMQRDFFRHIEQGYAEMITKLIPVIEDEFCNWKPGFRIENFKTEFWPTDISIPELAHTAPGVAWDWSFDAVHDANHSFTIYMHGGKPEPGLQMDG